MASPSPRPLTAWQAIFAGQVVVNLPIIGLFYGVYTLTTALLPTDWVRLLLAFVVSMAWGVYSSRRWRRWAIRRGVPEVELRRLAALTLLMMPGASRRTADQPVPKRPKKKK